MAARLRADGWREDAIPSAAAAALALVEGALLFARVSGQPRHFLYAKRAALVLLAAPYAENQS